MTDSRKVKIVVSSLLVVFLLGVIVTNVILNRSKKEVVLGVQEKQEVNQLTGIPYIISIAPIQLVQGEEYEYIVRVVDLDSKSNEISIEIESGPSWLEVEGNVVKGTVPENASGVYDFTLKVSDGINSSSQKNYILVEESSE